MDDPLHDPRIIPDLYAKIGALTVRCEMLYQENAALRAQLGASQNGDAEKKAAPKAAD